MSAGSVDGPIGGMKPGTVVEVDYDIPEDVWFFDENGHRTMPFVLTEAALPALATACFLCGQCAHEQRRTLL